MQSAPVALALEHGDWTPFPWWVYLFVGFGLGIFVGIGLTRLNARVLWREFLRARREEAKETPEETTLVDREG